MSQKYLILLLSFIALLSIGCESNIGENDLLVESYSVDEHKILSTQLDIPDLPYSYSFGNEKVGVETDHIATLGRVLFYDKDLSANGKVSCASCHQQSLAFADNHALSEGANGEVTHRNSMALGAFRSFGRQYETDLETRSTGLFWDERAVSIKEQLKETINNPKEMGMGLDELVDIVESKDYYQVLHKKAYKDDQINEDHILEALEVFINSISSMNTTLESDVISKLNYITGDSVVGKIENDLGLRLFATHCGSCHRSNVDFIDDLSVELDNSVANNGLSLLQSDLGQFEHTNDPQDVGKFKIPGLLNIELSAPYMHDGRFDSLEEVVEFYNSGIEFNPNLHPLLKQGESVKQMNLTEVEKTALVDFLKLLTDESIASEDKWSSPFIY